MELILLQVGGGGGTSTSTEQVPVPVRLRASVAVAVTVTGPDARSGGVQGCRGARAADVAGRSL